MLFLSKTDEISVETVLIFQDLLVTVGPWLSKLLIQNYIADIIHACSWSRESLQLGVGAHALCSEGLRFQSRHL